MNGVKFVAFISILIAIFLGYSILNYSLDSIDGTSAMNNCTVDVVSSNTVYGIVPMLLMIGAVIVVVGIIIWYIGSYEHYVKTHNVLDKYLHFLDKMVDYFFYGLFAYAIFGSVALAVYLMYRATLIPGSSEVTFEIAKYIIYGIIFFVGTAGVGYLFEKYIWSKYQKRKEQYEREHGKDNKDETE